MFCGRGRLYKPFAGGLITSRRLSASTPKLECFGDVSVCVCLSKNSSHISPCSSLCFGQTSTRSGYVPVSRPVRQSLLTVDTAQNTRALLSKADKLMFHVRSSFGQTLWLSALESFVRSTSIDITSIASSLCLSL
jgi:hypothetical protein